MITLTENELEYLQRPESKMLLMQNDFDKFFGGMTRRMIGNLAGWMLENNIDFLKDSTILRPYQFSNTTIKELIVPSNITHISDQTFSNAQIETIKFEPNDKIKFYGEVFSGSGIKNVILPEGLLKLPPELFTECSSLEYVFIPDSIKLLPIDLFKDCNTDNLVIEANYRDRKIDKLQCKEQDVSFYKEHLKFKRVSNIDTSSELEVN